MNKVNNQIQVRIEKLVGNVAEGYLDCDEMSDEMFNDLCTKLGISESVSSIEVDVEFAIEWDDDIPMVMIDSVVAYKGNKHIEIDELVDESSLSAEIESFDDGSWGEDRQASRGDWAHDAMMDE